MTKLIDTLNQIINLHEKMRGAYFYNPPLDAKSRRKYEEYNSLTSNFEYKGKKYRVEQKTVCSCNYVYYYTSYFEDGKRIKKDIRFIKKILKECQSQSL